MQKSENQISAGAQTPAANSMHHMRIIVRAKKRSGETLQVTRVRKDKQRSQMEKAPRQGVYAPLDQHPM
jgi:hypothetical protein